MKGEGGLALLVVIATLVILLTKVCPSRADLGVISNLVISTEVDRRYAVTHVASRMKNPSNASAELMFKMKLPKNAFVSSLVMEVDGKNYTSLVKEKEKAKKTYEKAKSKGKNTGLVEQKSLETFLVSTNVAAYEKVTFYLKYEELLQRVKGFYNLSLNVRPGYEIEELMVRVSIKETEPLTNFSILQTPGNEFSLSMQLIDDENFTTGASSLELSTEDCQKSLSLVYQTSNKGNGSDTLVSDGILSISYDLERIPDGGEVQIQDEFFVHFLSPEGLPLQPKHTVFVLDVSGSMDSNFKLGYVKKAMEAILKDMREHDTFEVIAFSNSVRSLGFFDGTKKSVERSLKRVRKLEANGGTNINQALLDAAANLNELNTNNAAKQVVFLTDGQPTIGVTSLDTIRENARAAFAGQDGVYSLAFGEGADLKFLRQISADSRGFARKIYEHLEPAEQLVGFYDEISKPLLRDVTIVYNDSDVLTNSVVQPGPLTYYSGDEVVVTGKLRRGVTWFKPTVSGKGEQGPLQLNVSRIVLGSPTPGRENVIERLWAYRIVQHLLDMMDVVKDEEQKVEMKAKALLIALEYNFVTKVTSLVVVRPEDLDLPEEESDIPRNKELAQETSQFAAQSEPRDKSARKIGHRGSGVRKSWKNAQSVPTTFKSVGSGPPHHHAVPTAPDPFLGPPHHHHHAVPMDPDPFLGPPHHHTDPMRPEFSIMGMLPHLHPLPPLAPPPPPRPTPPPLPPHVALFPRYGGHYFREPAYDYEYEDLSFSRAHAHFPATTTPLPPTATPPPPATTPPPTATPPPTLPSRPSLPLPVDNDPHFIAHVKNSSIPYCFDFHARPGEVLSLVRDGATGIVINALVTSSFSHTKKTYIESLFLSLPGVNVTITPENLHVECSRTRSPFWVGKSIAPPTPINKDSSDDFNMHTMDNHQEEDYDYEYHGDRHPSRKRNAMRRTRKERCGRHITWKCASRSRFSKVQFRLLKKNQLEISLEGDSNATFIVTRAKTKHQQKFLGFYIVRPEIFSPRASGILGQFERAYVISEGKPFLASGSERTIQKRKYEGGNSQSPRSTPFSRLLQNAEEHNGSILVPPPHWDIHTHIRDLNARERE